MSKRALVWGSVVCLAIMVVVLSAWRLQRQQAQAAPPLSLEGYLDEELPEAKPQVEMKVDNGPCYVCHANYRQEPLVLAHGPAGVGCIDCHGSSDDHRNDENNIIPPDRMYPLAAIDQTCGKCHRNHDVSAREVILCWQTRCPEKTDPEQIVCTDCHFEHRLSNRVVRWDKESGEVLAPTVDKP